MTATCSINRKNQERVSTKNICRSWYYLLFQLVTCPVDVHLPVYPCVRIHSSSFLCRPNVRPMNAKSGTKTAINISEIAANPSNTAKKVIRGTQLCLAILEMKQATPRRHRRAENNQVTFRLFSILLSIRTSILWLWRVSIDIQECLVLSISCLQVTPGWWSDLLFCFSNNPLHPEPQLNLSVYSRPGHL